MGVKAAPLARNLFVIAGAFVLSLVAMDSTRAASRSNPAAEQWAAYWSWSLPLGGADFGGTKPLILVFNPADPDDPKSQSATVSVKFYTGACKKGTLFSTGGGPKEIAPGEHALFFVYPEPSSGGSAGCLLIESTQPVLPNGEIVVSSYNPVTGEQDSRSSTMAFWSVGWQPSAP